MEPNKITKSATAKNKFREKEKQIPYLNEFIDYDQNQSPQQNKNIQKSFENKDSLIKLKELDE